MAKFSPDNSNHKLKLPASSISHRMGKKTSAIPVKSEDPEKKAVDVPMKEFLDFLRTAYQVNQAIEGAPFSLAQNVEVNWKQLTSSSLCSLMCSTEENAKSGGIVEVRTEGVQEVEKLMKIKLNEILQEGLLDSMIPYILPKHMNQPVIKKPVPVSNLEPLKPHLEKSSRIVNGPNQIVCSKDKAAIRRKSSTIADAAKISKGDTEVEIHVCDEVRNVKKKFKCPQRLLVSKMGYFAEVTTGQKLEDMDISVHCDLNIFDWLMRWVKKDSLPEDNWPHLEASNVVSILVSASFLQMDPLENDCLNFLYKNANDILKTSSNLSCLNDNILSKLTRLFSNSDIEALADKKDKIQSRLYCKLISALVDGQPDPRKGHFSKLSSLYKCNKCDKLIMKEVQNDVPCIPQNMRMDRMGKVHATHSRDPLWDLNEYVRSLRSALGSWQLVYWHLWGECHILQCYLCHLPFSLLNISNCSHHTEPALFVSVGGRAPRGVSYPVGHYPCCGARTFRFEPLSTKMGCKLSDHQPELLSKTDAEIWHIFLKHRHLITQEVAVTPSQGKMLTYHPRKDSATKSDVSNESPFTCMKSTSVSQPNPWWSGLNLAPRRPPHGLLMSIWELYRRADQQPQQGSQDGKIVSVTGLTLGAHRTGPQKKQLSIEEAERMTPHSSSSTGDSISSSSSDGDDSSGDETGWDGAGWTGEGTEEEVRAGDWSSQKCKELTRQQLGSICAGRWISSALGATRKSHASNPSGPSMPFQPRKSRWSNKLSTRANQDNQRELEEKAMNWASAVLTRRTVAVNSLQQKPRPMPLGGIYVRLEQEWREANGLNAHSKSVHHGSRQRARTWKSSQLHSR
ncbi:SANT and BTB domain regulator of class switch recombination isoform X2 [Ischnura elegans]|uniref:SANT and BTB domain regulator of class switch recombination isoform X2 n=1 Tax=Ischnura elegans TaxID=197161 RepID=UPI001ED8AFB5|nr:SANT and BTB domain regulator of class switch recombination isoform X2 [Ischnura elegans]